MSIDEEFMNDFLEELGFDLFEFEEGWRGRFESQFSEWAAANHPQFHEEHPDNAPMIERLMKDEEEGGAIAGFINQLGTHDQRRAYEGMVALLERAEMTDSAHYSTLKELLS